MPPQFVETEGWRAWTTYEITYRNHDDPLVATGEHPLEQPQLLYKEVWPATTARAIRPNVIGDIYLRRRPGRRSTVISRPKSSGRNLTPGQSSGRSTSPSLTGFVHR